MRSMGIEKDERLKMIRKYIILLAAGFFLFCFLHPLQARAAAADGVEGTPMVISKRVQAREEPREDAAVVVGLESGNTVFVTQDRGDGWCEIYYQGKTAYVKSDAVSGIQIDLDSLNDELKQAEDNGKSWVESFEMQKDAIRRSKIWRFVILGLILAIFVTGVVSALKKNEE